MEILEAINFNKLSKKKYASLIDYWEQDDLPENSISNNGNALYSQLNLKQGIVSSDHRSLGLK